MSERGTGYRAEQRRGRRVLVIDFWYRDPTGKRKRFKRDASVQTATAARMESARYRSLAASTGYPDGEPSGKVSRTFRQFVDGTWQLDWSPQFRPSTRKRYNELLDQGILAAFGSKRLDEIDAASVASYAAKLKSRGIQSWPHVSLISSILRAAVTLGALDAMPTLPPAGKPKRKLPRCPSDSDVAGIMEHTRTWLRLACGLAALAGLRSGEARALEAGDVSLSRGEIHVQRAISADEVSTTKSDEDRIVPIAPDIRPLLVEAMKGKRRQDRIVVTRDGVTPTRQNILWRLQRTERRHGLTEWSFHALRHYFCTSLIRRGVNIASVQVVAGHADIETTMQYVHPEADDARRVMMSTQRALTLSADLN